MAEFTRLADAQPELTQPLTPEPAAPEITPEQASTMPMSELRKVALGEAATPSQSQPTPGPQPSAQPYTVTQTPEGVEIHLETGAVYKGKDWQEAALSAAKGKVEADKHIREMNTWRKEYDAWRAGQNLDPATAPQPPAETPMLSPEEQQAAEAQAQAAQTESIRQWLAADVLTPEMKRAFVAEAIGVQPEALESIVNQIYENNVNFATQRAYADFCAVTPEFADTPENTAAVMEHLQVAPGNLPTGEDLSRAWALALYSGKAKPAMSIQTPQRRTPPPAMPSFSASSGPSEPDPYKMPLAELKKAAFGNR